MKIKPRKKQQQTLGDIKPGKMFRFDVDYGSVWYMKTWASGDLDGFSILVAVHSGQRIEAKNDNNVYQVGGVEGVEVKT